MIRTTREAPYFGLWRDLATLDALAYPEFLTTARYEPINRSSLGTGHVDLLFEKLEQSCVIGAIRLSPLSLVSRERSPFIWPAHLARLLEAKQLRDIEGFITPWLRSLARARSMARESIRRYAASDRFDRARAAELYGATSLDRVMPRMAPFIYARRFAAGSRVLIDCADQALADAVLTDLATSIAYTGRSPVDDESGDRAFARSWYGVRSREARPIEENDLVVSDTGTIASAAVVIQTKVVQDSRGAIIDVPSPAPWDLLYSFDAADAPVIARFSVLASEPPLRACAPLAEREVCGDCAGSIVLALSAEALAMRGADVREAETLKDFLTEEGFNVGIVAEIGDRQMAGAQLVHIFGAPFESHTISFAEAARARGINYVFDLAPRPKSASAFAENVLVLAFRAASDDTEMAEYLKAYEVGGLTGTPAPEPSAEEYARNEQRFAELATEAVAVLAAEEDADDLRASLPPAAASRICVRGVFAAPEPAPAPIGHLVPAGPFALVHATMCARSNALFATFSADRRKVPLVVAGPFYDVDYLQTLRTIAPESIVLVDPEPGVLAALYRRAAIWIDSAPRPRSAAGLSRAVSCGALPVLAEESPLCRVAGPGIPTFALSSFEECSAVLAEAMAFVDRDERVTALQARLRPRSDPTLAFAGLMAAYALRASPV